MAETIFRIAHLSDPHLGPLPFVKLTELFGKRLTGYLNYTRNRSSCHDMTVLDVMLNDLAQQHVDHIVCTGDLVNIGIESEFANARAFLARLGSPDGVSCIPGNHDAYVKNAFEGLFEHIGAWMQGDDATQATDIKPCFPYVKRRGKIAIIGLSSAIPTRPFSARGKLGYDQIKATTALLNDLRREGAFRVILIHHPPFRSAGHITRGLSDVDAFQKMLKETGAELILCGHNHTMQTHFCDGLTAPVPTLVAPSASAGLKVRSQKRIASYVLIDVALSDQFPPHVKQVTRRFYHLGGCVQSGFVLSAPVLLT